MPVFQPPNPRKLGRFVIWSVGLLTLHPAQAHGPIADVQVSAPDPMTQNETAVVAFKQCPAGGPVTPLDVVLVAYNDNSGGSYRISVDRSQDGGLSFAPAFSFSPAVAIGDPVLAVGPTPAASPPPCGPPGPPPPPPPIYLAFVSPDLNFIGLSVSNTGGLSWGPAMNMSAGLTGLHDKPWLDVNRQTGTAYVCWTRMTPTQQELSIRVTSTDGLYTNAFVSDMPAPGRPFVGAQGCQVKVDPVLGAVFFAWFQNPGPGNQPAILFRACSTTVASCGAIRVAAHDVRPIGAPHPACNGYPALNGPIDVHSFPTLAIDDFSLPGLRRSFIVAWADHRLGDADILAVSSRDLGLSWTGPVRVNDDVVGNGRSQFHPAITAARVGAAKLQWYDRRADPTNTQIRLWSGLAHGGGIQWTNAAVSDIPFAPPAPNLGAGRPCYTGDYNGITFDLILAGLNVGPHYFHTWGDYRSGDADVFFDVQGPETPPLPNGLVPETPGFSLAAGAPSTLPTSGAPYHPADILRRDVGGPPLVGIACASLGLTIDGCDDGADGDLDDLVALSFGDDFLPLPGRPPVFAFSVAPGSAGVAGSAVAIEAECSPPEPQADEFALLLNGVPVQAFDGDGAPCGAQTSPGLGLVETPGSDDIDALHDRDPAAIAPGGAPESPVYFSLGPASPSLAALGFTSGHIVKTEQGAPPTAYATPVQVGLTAGDVLSDICLLEDGDGIFEDHDLLFFTLDPGSPTLAAIGASASDVLRPGLPGLPEVVVSHDDLELLETDDLDALKCALAWLNNLGVGLPVSDDVHGDSAGPPVATVVEVTASNAGPVDAVAELWLWVDAPAEVGVRLLADPGDECVSPPSALGPDFEGVPAPLVDCAEPAVRGLYFQSSLAVGTISLARGLALTCPGSGTFPITIRAGLAAMAPLDAVDNSPGDEVAEQTFELLCTGDDLIFADGFESGDTSMWSFTS